MFNNITNYYTYIVISITHQNIKISGAKINQTPDKMYMWL